MAITANRVDDLAIQSATNMIRKGMIDWKMLGVNLIKARPEKLFWRRRIGRTDSTSRLSPTAARSISDSSPGGMRSILENRKNVDAGEIDGLIQAWTDWVDADDQ